MPAKARRRRGRRFFTNWNIAIPYPNEDEPVLATISRSLVGFEYRFYMKKHKDNDALVAYVVDRRRNPLLSTWWL